jgi:hypothetical protein
VYTLGESLLSFSLIGFQAGVASTFIIRYFELSGFFAVGGVLLGVGIGVVLTATEFTLFQALVRHR